MGLKFPWLPTFIMIIMFVLFIGFILSVIAIIRRFKRAKINGDKTAKKWYWLTLLCVVIMSISWIFNMGWFRVVLTWLPLPLIHACVFVWVNFKLASYASSFEVLKKYMTFSCITYLVPYLIFPDGGDVGGMYLFFGLIRNDIIASIMMCITPLALILNIIILILEIIELRKCRTRK